MSTNPTARLRSQLKVNKCGVPKRETFLPEGQATSLHVVVSVRGIVLEDTHFVPLFTASAIFSLNNWIQIQEHQNIWMITPCFSFGASTASSRARRPRAPFSNNAVN